jgi:predicted transposase YdaD
MGIREIVLDQAKNEGKQEGKKAGWVEGWIEGWVEGKQEGKLESKVDFVKNLIAARRFNTEEIAGFGDVTEKFVLDIMQTFDRSQGNNQV